MVSATLGLVLLFAVAVALHSELFRLRPAVGHLTRFYLAMSFGGMLGGLFCAIVAPLLFDWAYEHPLLVVAAALLVPQYVLVPWPERFERLLAFVLPALAFILSFAAEQGLLGLAFDPNYATNGRFFVHYTAAGGVTRGTPGESS